MIANPKSFHPVIRPLSEADLDRVNEIEQMAYPFPWTQGIFSDCLRVGYGCWGLHLDGELVGYTVFTLTANECHLLNLCIHPLWQRQGFGSLLLDHAIAEARRHACVSMFLEVRPSNPAGLSLYTKRGFRLVGERKEYYRSAGGRENALVMRLDLV